jgi:hypothetical protein
MAPMSVSNEGKDASVAPLKTDMNEGDPEKNAPLDAEDAVSLDYSYVAPPLITRSMVWGVGLFLFGLAMIWPPLLLLVTYIASVLIPYFYRVTDDASTRRYLLHQFEQDDHVSAHRREVPEDVRLETSYWTNSR